MIPRYRAWKKAGKELGRVGQITFELDGSVSHVLFKGKFLDFNVPINEIELMQSTGLKDKNGKEIFEGDVLEIEDEGEVLGNAKLTWHNEQAVFMIEAISVDDIAPFHEILSDESYSYRVVGNVYENPELLEDKE